jgi:hypothetical protein
MMSAINEHTLKRNYSLCYRTKVTTISCIEPKTEKASTERVLFPWLQEATGDEGASEMFRKTTFIPHVSSTEQLSCTLILI